MINIKCRKLFLRGNDFRCLVKNKVVTDCDKDCKDMVMCWGWKEIIELNKDLVDEYGNLKERKISKTDSFLLSWLKTGPRLYGCGLQAGPIEVGLWFKRSY